MGNWWPAGSYLLVIFARTITENFDMAFLTDITAHNLNTQLQGRSQTVSDHYVHMNAFQRKLNLFHYGFSSDLVNLTHFAAC